MDVSTLQVNRWRRYGKDRLYIEHADGTKVGFWDLQTDRDHPECPEQAVVLAEAVAAWKATQRAVRSSPTKKAAATSDAKKNPGPLRAESALTGERPWVDLSTNKAGAEAREQATAAREVAPVTSLLARAIGVHTAERAWRVGADGEKLVAAQLTKVAKKDPRWRFLHAVPVGSRGSDIDHLVVGPGGVFTVNTKHHPKATIWVSGSTFLVNGNKQPYLRNSRYEAARASELLSRACGFTVHTSAIITTVNAGDFVIKTPPKGADVMPRMQIASWLLRHGDVLGPDALDVIFAAARRSTTWVGQ